MEDPTGADPEDTDGTIHWLARYAAQLRDDGPDTPWTSRTGQDSQTGTHGAPTFRNRAEALTHATLEETNRWKG